MLGLRLCARAFSSCGKWGPLFIAVRRPLTIAASLVVEHRLQMRRLSSCGSRAQSLRGMWDLPRPGLEPVSSALAGGFSTTAPPGKPCISLLDLHSQVRPNAVLSIKNWFLPIRRVFFWNPHSTLYLSYCTYHVWPYNKGSRCIHSALKLFMLVS